jgi:hypothetical protein
MTGITKENARAFAARGNAVKRELKRLREERLGKIDYLLDHAARIAQENDKLKVALAEATAQDQDIYRTKRLGRVRKQLDLVDGMIEAEQDPAKLDRLASAQSRLSEQERQLSNRSLPPTLKAGPAPRSKRSSVQSDPEPI